jgi:nucleotide-binding universal stress UspA family protein
LQLPLIAVFTDFSPDGDLAVERALELARHYGARLIVAHVLPQVVERSPLLQAEQLDRAADDLEDELRRASQRALQERYLARAGQVPAETVLLEGSLVKEIVRLARERRVRLVVLGATGAGGRGRGRFGSVAAKLVRKSPCSVLVVRGPRA